jgi:hypothetical protein
MGVRRWLAPPESAGDIIGPCPWFGLGLIDIEESQFQGQRFGKDH